MYIYNNIDEIYEDIEDAPFLLLIISNSNCNVCKSIVKKIQDFLMMYPEVEIGYAESDVIQEVTNAFSAFSSPLILFYVEGKEVFRDGRFIRVTDLEKQIVKYYNLLHGELDG